MKMRKVAGITLLALGSILAPSTTNAGSVFFTGFTDWNELPQAQKTLYVAGIMDFIGAIAEPTELFRRALSKGVERCFNVHHTGPFDIAHNVDRLYGDYPGVRSSSPAVITYTALVWTCEKEINSEMAAVGQPSLDFGNLVRNLQR
jgi:hypothetical protein